MQPNPRATPATPGRHPLTPVFARWQPRGMVAPPRATTPGEVPHYVDLHAHYLPALDDGATDREMSLQMLRAIASLGFSKLFATPHQRAGMFMPERAAIDGAFQAAQADAAAAGLTAELGLGAENFW